jgi:hypothetical protein
MTILVLTQAVLIVATTHSGMQMYPLSVLTFTTDTLQQGAGILITWPVYAMSGTIT